jgi:uncharacterized protein YndB with AHSA1/START domain
MSNSQNTASTGNTIQSHRVLTSTPENIWRAFPPTRCFARWLPPNGFNGHAHAVDFKVNGSYRLSFTNFTTGSDIFFDVKRMLHGGFQMIVNG